MVHVSEKYVKMFLAPESRVLAGLKARSLCKLLRTIALILHVVKYALQRYSVNTVAAVVMYGLVACFYVL